MADKDAKAAVSEGMARFFDSQDLADFEIVCGGSKWRVHRLALSLQSPVLAKTCNGNFLESKQGKLDLSEHDSARVTAMLEYIYKFHYEKPAGLNAVQNMRFDIDMCVLGDKYDIQGLVKLSAQYCKASMDHNMNAADVAQVASHAYEFGNATGGTIRNMLISRIIERGLYSATGKNTELEIVMKRHPVFAIEMARSMSGVIARKRY